MKIIPRATLVFRPAEPGGDTFKVQPSATPIEAPDWLEDDDLFKLAVKDGSIIVASSPSTTVSQLSKVSDEDLVAEVLRRDPKRLAEIAGSGTGRYGEKATWTGSTDGTQYPSGVGSFLGGSPATPAPASVDAAAQQQERADAANRANSGKNGGPAPVSVMTAKTGDEKTSRDDAPGATGKEPLPASVDPKLQADKAAAAEAQGKLDPAAKK